MLTDLFESQRSLDTSFPRVQIESPDDKIGIADSSKIMFGKDAKKLGLKFILMNDDKLAHRTIARSLAKGNETLRIDVDHKSELAEVGKPSAFRTTAKAFV